jgi:hypothetical protein
MEITSVSSVVGRPAVASFPAEAPERAALWLQLGSRLPLLWRRRHGGRGCLPRGGRGQWCLLWEDKVSAFIKEREGTHYD